MKIILKKINKKLVIFISAILLLSATIMISTAPKKVKCTLNTDITNETVTATFRGNKLKYIKVTTSASYENNKEAEAGMKLQKFGMKVIENYGYYVTSKIENNTIIIEYYGKVKDIENNIYTKNIKIIDFKKSMEERRYECK